MNRFVLAIAVVVAASTASWFGAVSYVDWKRHTEAERFQAEWLTKCGVMKDIILFRIKDPSNELKTGQFVGIDDRNWDRCRRVGVITADDEQKAYVERQRRQNERREKVIARDAEMLARNPALAECVFDEKKADCSAHLPPH